MDTKDEQTLAAILERATVAELLAVNRRLIARLRALRQVSDSDAAASIVPGTVVSFAGRGGERVTGKVERVNRTTLTVVVKSPFDASAFPQRWRVHASACEVHRGEK